MFMEHQHLSKLCHLCVTVLQHPLNGFCTNVSHSCNNALFLITSSYKAIGGDRRGRAARDGSHNSGHDNNDAGIRCGDKKVKRQ